MANFQGLGNFSKTLQNVFILLRVFIDHFSPANKNGTDF